jgi:putative transcriptional regulator
MNSTDDSFTGQLLIAMPGMADPRFAQSVVYLCAHSEDGAMGLIVNKPTPEIKFRDMLSELDIPTGDGMRDIRVHFGGPVEQGRGFVLHSGDYTTADATLRVDDEVAMTSSRDILESLATGAGPADSMLALGYSGWGPGQLEGEILRNGWLTAPARRDILFGRANEHKWAAALKLLGIDPLTLSATSGRA